MDITKITLQNAKVPDFNVEELLLQNFSSNEDISTEDTATIESEVGIIINHQESNESLHISSSAPTNENHMKCEIKLEQKNEDKEMTICSNINLKLVAKYFNIWKEKSLAKEAGMIKEEQINKFIDKLKQKQIIQKKKEIAKVELKNVKNHSSDTKQAPTCTNASELFQNRYKAQRDIILMQKSKLLEQEQMIQELQYGKICEELKTSFKDSQATIKKLLTKFSTRTKIVTGLKIVEDPEEIQMKINKVPKLVKQMEQRAQDRELKRRIILERKRLIDEERQRLIAEQIENKRIQDEDEKKKNLEAIKDRRRREVEDEKRRLNERAKYLEKMKCAERFYKKKLKKRGVLGFKLLMQQKEENENISAAYYEVHVVSKCFYRWKLFVEKLQQQKLEKAVHHYEKKLKQKSFRGLLLMRVKVQQNIQVATDFHNYQIQCKVFKKFYLIVNAIKIRRYYLMRIATRHYKTRLLVQSFYQWKSLPAVLQLERAKEEKKRKWREKVLEVLPDYRPPEL